MMDEKEREAIRRAIFARMERSYSADDLTDAVLAVLPSRETPVEDARDVIATVKAHSTIAAGLTLTPNDVDALVLWINEHESRETVAPVLELPETPDGRKRIHWLRRDFIEDRALRETVAPTEEQVEAMVRGLVWTACERVPHATSWSNHGYRYVPTVCEDCQKLTRDLTAAVLALFPGESREAVEAAQRERDAQIVKDQRPKLPPRFEIGEQARRREAIVERAALDRAASAIREAGR